MEPHNIEEPQSLLARRKDDTQYTPPGQVDPLELDRKTYNLFILYHASLALSGVLDVEEILGLCVDMTTEVMSVQWGLFYLVNEDEDVLELRRGKGIDLQKAPQLFRLGVGMSDWARSKTEAIPFEDLRPDMLICRSFPALKDLAPLSPYYLVPIFHKLRFVGILVLGKRIDDSTFTENDLELLSTLVSLSANALVSAHLYELAILDGNTKLFVVRYFRQRLKEEIKRAKRYTQPLTLIMLDIDHFKHVNDTYGHQSGDKVLGDIAAIVRKCTRETIDIPGRYGGEEFAIALPDTDLEGGYQVAERIRQVAEQSRFLKENISITVSAGVASYPMDAETDEKLVEKADMALYEAKRSGRNKIVLFNQLTAKFASQTDSSLSSLRANEQ